MRRSRTSSFRRPVLQHFHDRLLKVSHSINLDSTQETHTHTDSFIAPRQEKCPNMRLSCVLLSSKPFILSCIGFVNPLIIHECECNEYALRREHVAHRNRLKRNCSSGIVGGEKSFLRVQKYLLSVASSNRSAGPLKPRMVAL